jgi:uncharacterized protein YgiB involved in biofilm formation
MKRSKAVPLVLIGTLGFVALTGCEKQEEIKQNQYRSMDDCRRDWGDDSRNCTARTSNGAVMTYVGPRYFYDRNAGMPMVIEPNGATRPISGTYLSRGVPSTAINTVVTGRATSGGSVARGGFGGRAAAISGGG